MQCLKWDVQYQRAAVINALSLSSAMPIEIAQDIFMLANDRWVRRLFANATLHQLDPLKVAGSLVRLGPSKTRQVSQQRSSNDSPCASP